MCRSVVLLRKTTLFPPKACPGLWGALGEPWEALGEPVGGSGGALGELWEAQGQLWEALGELWEGLYIQKLPINRPKRPLCYYLRSNIIWYII